MSCALALTLLPGCEALELGGFCSEPILPDNEIVMTEGMKITAHTPVGTIAITAGRGPQRFYTWRGETRSVCLWPRYERWYGSYGLYYPGPGTTWATHDGINRALLEEGQQHFETAEAALEWLASRTYLQYVYRDDGLAVGWRKDRPDMTVEVWQILINGQKPPALEGSTNGAIVVTRE